MKPVLQFATAVTMLGGLLFQVVSHAAPTNMAEQPLKASVLAKPNVVFVNDDSGSMDFELILNGTTQGVFWGNYVSTPIFPSSALRTGSAPGDWNFYYLFPNGTATGAKVYADPSTTYGYAIPPTAEMAFTRSSDYNTLYYNSSRTYTPWSPAYIGSPQTYNNATPTAAKSHPVLGSATMDLTANQSSSSSDGKFTFTAGMTIPVGATNISCYSGSAGTLPYTVTTARMLCKATVSYYPATFYKKEDCGVVNGTTCVQAYDGHKLRRYEIKSGNTFPSGRSYADEMQNFANWFQYYRKRRLLLAAAMGGVLENITGLRMGIVNFNAKAAPTMFDADSSTAASNARTMAGLFYNNNIAANGTPTRGAYAYVRNEFDTNTNIIQYACQRNAAFILTDGFANDGAQTIPAYSQSTYGSGAPYQSITTGSLADQALAYFTLRLRATGSSPLPADKVPLGSQTITNPDANDDLHLNTYAVTLGMRGTVWPANTNAFANPPTWPTPVADTATMIDDLWHATINGRGQMYLATDIDSMIAGINAGLNAIKSEEGAQSSVAVSTFNLLASDGKAYEASYNPAGWIGDLTASSIDMNTGAISNTPTWSASTLLTARAWTDRTIFTSTAAGAGVPFTDANIGAAVNPDTAAFPVSADVVNYLRGKRDGEGSTFRTRTGLMGAVINAEPTIDSSTGVVYVASSEGMLHAFDTTDGKELWAFVPYPTLATIGKTVQRGYAFKTKLDGTPTIGKYTDGGAKLLVAGMGAAGRGYYALDVSTPKGMSSETAAAGQVKWRFPSTATSAYQANVGYTVGRPVIVKTANHGYVVLVTSGYDNGETIGDGKGRLWMLNANTGAVIHEFVTSAGAPGSEAGLSQIIAYGENTGTSRYVYGGDLLGNLWKFDLDSLGTPALVTTLVDAGNNPQPVTTAPQLTRINGKPVIMVATGRLLDISDFGGSSVQSVYAVVDNGSNTQIPRSNMDALTHNTSTRVISGTVDWVGKRGWYVDLPAGEHVNVDPKFALGWLYVNANSAGGSNCAQGASGYKIYVRSGSGVSDSLSTTAHATSPVLVQVNQKTMNRWTRLGNGGIGNQQYNVGKTHSPRSNAWRDSR